MQMHMLEYNFEAISCWGCSKALHHSDAWISVSCKMVCKACPCTPLHLLPGDMVWRPQHRTPSYNLLLAQVVKCIQDGLPLLIENLPEEIDAVLMPVVGKQIIKKGQRLILKLGDLEVDYDPRFRSAHTLRLAECACMDT